ncbi:Uncharacterized protein TCAP_00116 [Tolypocladium capitatum]|uniref:Uncharacterized protein n=1 Tax=Tolypocladium capitatum TaxID=45235 RepID=A0A2K3QR33_9HYPO|nr:Uncharacterized protein TCAP_00116 [Tolypocladium capitatum]
MPPAVGSPAICRRPRLAALTHPGPAPLIDLVPAHCLDGTDPRLQPQHGNMDPPDDPRANRPPGSMEAGPSRCNMESSFLTILHSSGFAEWAARAEAQNQQLGVGSWRPHGEAGTPPSSDAKSSRKPSSSSRPGHRPSSSSSSSKKGPRPRKHKDGEEKSAKSRTGRSGRSKPTEASLDEGEQMDEADNFVAHYANYNSMDAELNILKEHLMHRSGY